LGGSDPSYQTLDRFRMNIGGTSAGRFTMAQDSSAPEGFANSLKLSCTTADTSIAADELLSLQQRIEGQNLQMFAKGTTSAKPYAVSFYVKGNASATYTCELEDGDNSRRVAKEFSVTTDWARVELSFPKDTTGAFDDDNALSLSLNIFLHGGSNFTSGTFSSNTWESTSNTTRLSDSQTSFFDSTDRTFFITGVQLEVGQNPTAFEHEPFAVTKNKCLRYYWRQGGALVCLGSGAYYRGNLFALHMDLPVPMRVAPTMSINVNSSSFIIYSNDSVDYFDYMAPGRSVANETGEAYAIQWDTGSGTSGTQGHGGVAITQNSGQYVELTAEL
jgi:hypothetical protein